MRRLAACAAAAVGLAAVSVAALADSPAHRSSSYAFDAIFDTSNGLISGNNVMIAGAKVGTVTGAALASGYKARIEMTIDGRYGPFHTDANCQIRPVALIGEMEVNCDPGTPGSAPLKAVGGQPPTIPVARTTVPVDFTDLFNIWSSPVSQRLSVLLWNLGAGLAGRGEDLNAVLGRSNPTLELAQQTVGTLDQQRAQLARFVDATDHLLARLAPHSATLQRFLDGAAAVTEQTGAHSSALAETVHRLPALLTATRPALQQLDTVAANATPVLSNLRQAAPNLNLLTGELVPLAHAAGPALAKLGQAATPVLRNQPALVSLIVKLRQFAHSTRPLARLLNGLFTSLRQRGFVEGLNATPYYLAAATSRFDATSHMAFGNFLATGCAGSQESQLPQCSADFNTATSAAAARPQATRRQTRPAGPQTLQSLLDYLLK